VAAAREAEGLTATDPEAGIAALADARQAWERLGLPLDAARAEMLRARRLGEQDPVAAREAAEEAARRYRQLGVEHQAEQARELIPT
jgi:hypothetical protein